MYNTVKRVCCKIYNVTFYSIYFIFKYIFKLFNKRDSTLKRELECSKVVICQCLVLFSIVIFF